MMTNTNRKPSATLLTDDDRNLVHDESGSLAKTAPTDPGPVRFGPQPKSYEDAAHAELNSRAGRTVTVAEWALAQQRKLLEFITILRAWNQKANHGESGFDNV